MLDAMIYLLAARLAHLELGHRSEGWVSLTKSGCSNKKFATFILG